MDYKYTIDFIGEKLYNKFIIIISGDYMGKIMDLFNTIKSNWKTPAEGNYVPYKEIVSYSLGGTGVYFITAIVGMIGLSAGSMIVGASIGITAMDLQTMNVISTLIMLLMAPTRAMLFDNTKSKMGKFRPYLLTLGLPTAIIGTVFVYLPYETMAYNEKLVAVFVCYTLLQFFSPFYSAAYSGLVQVMSANSKERSWIIEISSIIYSFAPTVINPVMPLIGPLDDIKTYRIGFPIFCTIGVIISMLCVFGTKERVIVPKKYVQKMNFFEGLKKVSHNKYFWIINISQWFAFLNQGYSYIFQWIFYYGMNNPAIYSIMTVIKGEAYTPGMVAAAPLANKLGKKKLCLLSLSIQTVCLVLMLFFYKNYILLFACIFIKEMVGAVSIIYLPAMKADMMDYQQYKTGDRLEGFIEQGGVLIGSIVALATGYVFPIIFKGYGLTNNYDDLYNAAFRTPLVRVSIICAIIGTILSIIPFIFYDLSEGKRKNMITALKLRAMFSDYDHDDFDNSKLVEVFDLVFDAEESLAKYVVYQTKQEKECYMCAKIICDEVEKLKAEDIDKWNKIVEEYESIKI